MKKLKFYAAIEDIEVTAMKAYYVEDRKNYSEEKCHVQNTLQVSSSFYKLEGALILSRGLDELGNFPTRKTTRKQLIGKYMTEVESVSLAITPKIIEVKPEVSKLDSGEILIKFTGSKIDYEDLYKRVFNCRDRLISELTLAKNNDFIFVETPIYQDKAVIKTPVYQNEYDSESE